MQEHAPPPPRFERWQRIAAILGAPTIVLVVGVVSYFSVQRARDARLLIGHTREVITATFATLSTLQDAETGQRGYVITGMTSYLAPYDRALASIGADTSRLRALLAGSPRQRQRLDTLSTLVSRKLDELAKTIDLRRAGHTAEAIAFVQSGAGKQSMDAIRNVLAAIAAEDHSVLEARVAEEERLARLAFVMIIGGTIAAAIVALVTNGLLARYATAQEHAKNILMQQNAQLSAQAVELELQQQQLQDQATELEMQNEELQEQAAALEVANTAKAEFLAAMSHELRTPLNAIGGYVDLLTMGVRGPVTEPQQEDLRRIKKSGQHLLSLINEILNFARVGAGRIEYNVTRVPLSTLLSDVASLMTPQMRSKEISCTLAAFDGTIAAYADEEKVQQIVLNLLTNAYKFTDRGGRVLLDCVATDRADGDGPTMVQVRVVDTGRGIASDQLEAIFEPFVQIDRRLTPENEQGLGLGLAISRDLARGMGGDLTVQSIVGQGSTFMLALPRDVPTARVAPSDAVAERQALSDTVS